MATRCSIRSRVVSDAMDFEAKLFGLRATAHHLAHWDIIYEAIAYSAKVRGYAKVHGFTITQAPFTGGSAGGSTSTGGGGGNAPAKKMIDEASRWQAELQLRMV